jgi:hypothetical protein
MNTRVKIVLLAAVALVAIYGFGSWVFRIRNEIEVHSSRVDWLPATASDISSCRITAAFVFEGVHVYEFRMARADFELLSRERDWPMEPIHKPVTIDRYVDHLPDGHPEAKGTDHATSSSGLYYAHYRGNGGGIAVLYDDATSMAYVSISSR